MSTVMNSSIEPTVTATALSFGVAFGPSTISLLSQWYYSLPIKTRELFLCTEERDILVREQ